MNSIPSRSFPHAGFCLLFLLLGCSSPLIAQVYEKLHQFYNTGTGPRGTLVRGADGSFYGTTQNGGGVNQGTVFRAVPPTSPDGEWTLTTLVSFSGSTGGNSNPSGLAIDAQGHLYGTTGTGGTANRGTIFEIIPPTGEGSPWRMTRLAEFDGTNGATPAGRLMLDTDGSIYGVTGGGGIANSGTIYRLSPPAVTGGGRTLTTLIHFTGANGAAPSAGLVKAADGNFYGTCLGSDTSNGLVFQLVPPPSNGGAWTVNTLVAFTGATTGSFSPRSELLVGTDGNLYGTNSLASASAGAVFRLERPSTAGGKWTFTTLVTGGGSYGPLVQASDGSLYGTTRDGGGFNTTTNTSNRGTVYRVAQSAALGGAWRLVTLAAFQGDSGETLEAGVTFGLDGNFYGVALNKGANSAGTFFRVTPSGTLNVKGNFTQFLTTGPRAGLAQGSDGAFYGTTAYTASSQSAEYGSVFRIAGGGTFETLWKFTGRDGRNPAGEMLPQPDGSLLGTTSSGGTDTDGVESLAGTIYRISQPTVSGVAWNLTSLASFANVTNVNGTPQCPLLPSSDGSFYGSTTGAGGTIFRAIAGNPWTISTVTSFGDGSNGRNSYAGLVSAPAGTLYGTTTSGGNSD